MMNKQFTFDENLVSDLHKDAYGFRPSGSFWLSWGEASDLRRQEIWDDLLVDLDRACAEHDRATSIACVDLEDRIAFMQATIVGCTRHDAIRYLLDVYNCGDWVEHLEWHLNVPYGYLTKEFGQFMEAA